MVLKKTLKKKLTDYEENTFISYLEEKSQTLNFT